MISINESLSRTLTAQAPTTDKTDIVTAPVVVWGNPDVVTDSAAFLMTSVNYKNTIYGIYHIPTVFGGIVYSEYSLPDQNRLSLD